MKPKRIIASFLFCLMTFSSMNAQFHMGKKKGKETLIIENRPLLVVMQDNDSENSEAYNQYIKESMDSAWTFSENIKYISNEEFLALKEDKSKNKDFAYLMYTTENIVGNVPSGCLIIGLGEKIVSTHFTHIAPFDDLKLNKTDMVFGLNLLQFGLNAGKDIKAANKQIRKFFLNPSVADLQGKTLLIDEDLATSELKKKIKDTYKFDYKFVSKSIIDQAILTKKENTLYIRDLISRKRPILRSKIASGVDPGSKGTNGVTVITKTYETSVSKGVTYFVNTVIDAETGKYIFCDLPKVGSNDVTYSIIKRIAKKL